MNIKRFLIGFVIVSLSLGLAFFGLRLKKINCNLKDQTQTIACPKELTQSLTAKYLHYPLIFTNFETLLATDPLIFGHYLISSTEKVWPNKLELTLKPDTLVYQLETKDGLFALSKSGIANKLEEPDDHLVLVKNNLIDPNQTQKLFDARLQQAIQTLNQTNVSVDSIQFQDQNLATIYTSQPKTKILVDFFQESPLAGLKEILASEEFAKLNDPKKVVVIDLRFKLPVLHSE